MQCPPLYISYGEIQDSHDILKQNRHYCMSNVRHEVNDHKECME